MLHEHLKVRMNAFDCLGFVSLSLMKEMISNVPDDSSERGIPACCVLRYRLWGSITLLVSYMPLAHCLPAFACFAKLPCDQAAPSRWPIVVASLVYFLERRPQNRCN